MVPNPPSKVQSMNRFMLMNMPMIPAVVCSVHGEKEAGSNTKTKTRMETTNDLFSFFDEPTPEFPQEEERPPLDLTGLFSGFSDMNDFSIGIGIGLCQETNALPFQPAGCDHSPYILSDNPMMAPFEMSFFSLSDDEHSNGSSVGGSGSESVGESGGSVGGSSYSGYDNVSASGNESDYAALVLYANETLVEDDDFSTGVFGMDTQPTRINVYRRTLRQPLSPETPAQSNLVMIEEEPQSQPQSNKIKEAEKKLLKTLKPKKDPPPPCENCGRCMKYKRGKYLSKRQKEELLRNIQTSNTSCPMIMQ